MCAFMPLPRNLTSERPAYSRSVWVIGPLSNVILSRFPKPATQTDNKYRCIKVASSRDKPCLRLWLNTPYPCLHPVSKKVVSQS